MAIDVAAVIGDVEVVSAVDVDVVIVLEVVGSSVAISVAGACKVVGLSVRLATVDVSRVVEISVADASPVVEASVAEASVIKAEVTAIVASMVAIVPVEEVVFDAMASFSEIPAEMEISVAEASLVLRRSRSPNVRRSLGRGSTGGCGCL